MKAEEIRSALEEVSKETLADALSIVFAEGKSPDQSVAGMDKPKLDNFAQAVMYLKKNYDFEELDYFSTEADLVYVNAGDRRILLTDRMNAIPGIEGGTQPGGGQGKEEPGREDTASNGGRFSNLEI